MNWETFSHEADVGVRGDGHYGGVGFDISCGVRTLHTGLKFADIGRQQSRLADLLYARIPAGVGSTGGIRLDAAGMAAMLTGGARWAAQVGHGSESDLAHIEESGCVAGADPAAVSEQARKRQRDEMGTLGSGSHCLERQVVSEIFDERIERVTCRPLLQMALPGRMMNLRNWRNGLPWLVLAIALLAGVPAAADQGMAAERRAMVAEVVSMARNFGAGTPRETIDSRVLGVLGRIPRHEFVPSAVRPNAYDNRPLPIGHGQTISQPYIVAVMSDLLKVGAGDTVLEIGTGSGYQAAVLAELGAKLSSIEIVEPLAREASERLRRLGYASIATKVGDGYDGWAEQGPFDAIVVTAAASHVPPPLVRQLKPGGRMVIPVGAAFQPQQLLLVEKRADGAVTTRQVMPVMFVPLVGGHN